MKKKVLAGIAAFGIVASIVGGCFATRYNLAKAENQEPEQHTLTLDTTTVFTSNFVEKDDVYFNLPNGGQSYIWYKMNTYKSIDFSTTGRLFDAVDDYTISEVQSSKGLVFQVRCSGIKSVRIHANITGIKAYGLTWEGDWVPSVYTTETDQTITFEEMSSPMTILELDFPRVTVVDKVVSLYGLEITYDVAECNSLIY